MEIRQKDIGRSEAMWRKYKNIGISRKGTKRLFRIPRRDGFERSKRGRSDGDDRDALPLRRIPAPTHGKPRTPSQALARTMSRTRSQPPSARKR